MITVISAAPYIALVAVCVIGTVVDVVALTRWARRLRRHP